MTDKKSSRIYGLIFNPGEVVEIRGLGLSGKNPAWEGWAGSDGVVYGYFDNAEKFHQAAASLDKAGASGVYFTLNPCQDALIARACNRLVVAGKKRPLTGDSNIKCVRWFPIDIDPKRPAGISSSAEEIDHSFKVARKVKECLQAELGFPQHIGGFSGNGYHILYRLEDAEPTEGLSGSNGLIAQSLKALEDKFGDDQVSIDQKVFNPARIWKVYGTTARKGDHTEARPHRASHLYKSTPQSLDQVPVLSLEQLEKLAGLAPPEKRTSPSSETQFIQSDPDNRNHAERPNRGALDVEAYLKNYGITLKAIKPRGDAIMFLLDECLFDASHRGGEAAIVSSPHQPFLTYQCFHDSCRQKTWKDARAQISGKDPIQSFFKENEVKANTVTVRSKVFGYLTNLSIRPGDHAPMKLPEPDEIHPAEFYQNRGRREAFSVFLMANYLACHFAPIVHTSGIFWRYKAGVWSPIPKSVIHNVVHLALKDRVQAAWYKTSREALAALTNWEESEWQPTGNMVNVSNGMYDLDQQRLVDHSPAYKSRSQIPTACDENATCERWIQFLDEVFDGDKEKALLLQEFFGYILMPTSRFEKALFLYGTGANGKSTVLKVLEEILGKGNISHLTLDDLSNRFQVHYLKNRMVNIAAEVDTRERAGTEVLKMAISGDTLEGDVKYGERTTFQSHVKFVFAMNSPPVIGDKSHGFSRKVIVLNFQRRFAPEEMDRDLVGKLLQEKEGILAWAIDGAIRLIEQNGFSIAGRVQKDTDNFMAQMNPVLIYLEERCVQGPDQKVPVTMMFLDYKEWASESGVKPLSKSRFYEQVTNHCDLVKEKQRIEWEGSRPYGFIGVGLST